MTPHQITRIRMVLAQAQVAAADVETDLPYDMRSEKWQAAKHSPTPWNTVHSHYMATDCDKALLTLLAVRSQLADVIEKLNWCVVQAEAEQRPVDLKLAKVKRTA